MAARTQHPEHPDSGGGRVPLKALLDLIELAKTGKADIDVAYTITRYRVSPATEDYPVIYVSISDEDSTAYDDVSYFTDGDRDLDLTEDEANDIADVISTHFVRR